MKDAESKIVRKAVEDPPSRGRYGAAGEHEDENEHMRIPAFERWFGHERREYSRVIPPFPPLTAFGDIFLFWRLRAERWWSDLAGPGRTKKSGDMETVGNSDNRGSNHTSLRIKHLRLWQEGGKVMNNGADQKVQYGISFDRSVKSGNWQRARGS
jgi:hypothetical protein